MMAPPGALRQNRGEPTARLWLLGLPAAWAVPLSLPGHPEPRVRGKPSLPRGLIVGCRELISSWQVAPGPGQRREAHQRAGSWGRAGSTGRKRGGGGIGAKGEQEAPGALPAGMGSPPAWVTKHADQMLLPAPHHAPQECQPRAAGNRTPPCTEFLKQGGVSIKMPSPPSTSTMGSTTVCILTVLLVGSFPWKCFSRSTGCGGCRAGWLLGLLLVAEWWSCRGWESSWKSLWWRHYSDQELRLCCRTPAGPASVLEQECPRARAEIQHRGYTARGGLFLIQKVPSFSFSVFAPASSFGVFFCLF